MRVLVVSAYAPPHVGGIQNLVDQEVRTLSAHGHEVVLVTSDAGSLRNVPVYSPGVHVERVRAWHVLERRFEIFYPLFSLRLLPTLWRETGRCDVMHLHGLVFLSSVIAVVLGWWRGRPRLVTEHLGPYRSESRLAAALAWLLMETIGRLTARLATRLVSFGPSVHDLLERLARGRHKLLLLPKPLDRSLFHPPTAEQRHAARARLGWSSARPKVLFVGRLIADKGVVLLQEAEDPSFDLVFCGPGDSALVENTRKRPVEYLPPRSQAELIALYHAADLVALPSMREGGLPLVAMEALACGLKVVLANYDGAEAYSDVPGLLLCERNPISIRQTILGALVTPDRFANNSRDKLLALSLSADDWITHLYAPFVLRKEEAASFLHREGRPLACTARHPSTRDGNKGDVTCATKA
jgi:glycosyltransferase involved in cell wall biosynthesis